LKLPSEVFTEHECNFYCNGSIHVSLNFACANASYKEVLDYYKMVAEAAGVKLVYVREVNEFPYWKDYVKKHKRSWTSDPDRVEKMLGYLVALDIS
jgi:hypothetical protein